MIQSKNENKTFCESKFEKVLRICLIPRLFDLLQNDSKGMLYCTKFVTSMVIKHCIKNISINLSTVNKIEKEKRIMIRHLYVDIQSNFCENLQTATFKLNSLTFCETFNQPIKAGVLPQSLQHLTFGRYFNQPIEINVLPQSLSCLTFGPYYYQTIEVGVLPSSLKSLTFTYKCRYENEKDRLLSSLPRLSFGHNLIHPNSFQSVLNSLALGYCDENSNPINFGVLPPFLNDLAINIEYDYRADGKVPKKSKYGWKFNPLPKLNLLNSVAPIDVLPPILSYLIDDDN